MHITVAARSHIGHRRKENQDAALVGNELVAAELEGGLSAKFGGHDLPRVVAAIADGIGGAPGGREASAAALDCLRVHSPFDKNSLLEAILNANAAAYARAAEDPRKAGMGTTLAAALCTSDNLIFMSVGDSFLAEITPRFVRPLVQPLEQILAGTVLDAAIGGGRSFQIPRIDEVIIEHRESRYFLATDGIVRYTAWDELREILLNNEATPAEALEQIMACVLKGPAGDNATCALIEVTDV